MGGKNIVFNFKGNGGGQKAMCFYFYKVAYVFG